MPDPLPDPLPVRRAVRVSGEVRPPGSKSVSHRALNLAMLARRPVTITNLLAADDIAAFLVVLEAMGFGVRSRPGAGVQLAPPKRGVHRGEVRLDCGAAGTLLRLLVGSCAVTPGDWLLDGVPRLRERPVGPLVRSLVRLGARIEERGLPGCAPLLVRGGPLAPGTVEIDASESSQYVSALLMAALGATGPITVLAPVLVSGPYVDTTLEVMAAFGAAVEARTTGAGHKFRVVPGLPGPAGDRYHVAADDSAAAYSAAAAAICGGAVSLRGLLPDSPQPDRGFLDLLRQMGARVQIGAEEIRVEGTGQLTAVDCDLSAMPDQVPTLATVAAFARGVTWIRNVSHLRIKESDRLAAMATELGRVGVSVDELPDGLRIEGNPRLAAAPHADPVAVDTHDDHRIAMSMALVGLRRGGVLIRRPQVVAKSYPGFWRDLEALAQ